MHKQETEAQPLLDLFAAECNGKCILSVPSAEPNSPGPSPRVLLLQINKIISSSNKSLSSVFKQPTSFSIDRPGACVLFYIKSKSNHVSHKDFAIHIAMHSRILTFLLMQDPSGFSGGRGLWVTLL